LAVKPARKHPRNKYRKLLIAILRCIILTSRNLAFQLKAPFLTVRAGAVPWGLPAISGHH
jgi:hypothetical protein